MELKCKINNQVFDCVIGNTITDNYNETLDSGTIILDHIKGKLDLKPFDDVYIYNSDEDFEGFNAPFELQDAVYKAENREEEFAGRPVYITSIKITSTYAEMLTYGGYFLAKIVNVPTYLYVKMKLMTRKLEITDLLTGKVSEVKADTQGNYTIHSWRYTKEGISPDVIYFVYKEKLQKTTLPTFYRHFLIDDFSEERLNLNTNIYKYKINLMSEIKRLEKVQLPNISITQPLNLEKKKSVYDYIVQFVRMYSPKIKYAVYNVSFRRNYWVAINKYSVDSSLEEIFKDVYAPDFSLNNPNLRDVLSQLFLTKDRIPYVKDNVIYALDITKRNGVFNDNNKRVNYVESSMSSSNFAQSLKRNYNNGLSQDNSAHLIEYLGFRNSNDGLLTIGNMRLETRFPIYKINKVYMCYYKKITLRNNDNVDTEKMFLCKQDITALVKLNEERNLLNQDWEDFTEDDVPNTVEELAEYKLATVGYDIGSNVIEGWGTKYSYVPDYSWFSNTKTYIENIFSFMDNKYPLGINSYNFIKQQQESGNQVIINASSINAIISPFVSGAAKFKSFIFLIDYNAFYNGTVIHSKDNDFGDLTDNDNPSSSLTLLESDGLFEKEKINRLGNKILRVNARYKSFDDIQELGSVYGDDYIVYQRTISIYPNYINVNYILTKDYVMRSYFTSVWAKIRTYNLLDYGQSVVRAENKKVFLLVSKDEQYYEGLNNIQIRTSLSIYSLLCSSFMPSQRATSKNYYKNNYKLNVGFFSFEDKVFMSDVNAFVSGYSLCFNTRMADNVSSGVYIKYPNPTFNLNADDEDKKTGSGQAWWMMVDDIETGKLAKVGVYFAHSDDETTFFNTTLDYSESEINNLYTNLLLQLPYNYKLGVDLFDNIIGQSMEVNKDNKEQLDFTYQIEPITRDKNIFFSQWFMKLNDLLGTYQKIDADYEVEDTSGGDLKLDLYCSTRALSTGGSTGKPIIFFYMTDAQLSTLVENQKITAFARWNQPSPTQLVDPAPHDFQITFNRLVSKSSESITFRVSLYYKYYFNSIEGTETDREITFTKAVHQPSETTNGNLYVFDFSDENGEFNVPKGSINDLTDLYNGYLIKYYNSSSSDLNEMPSASNSQIIPLYVDTDTIVVKTKYNKNIYLYTSNNNIDENLIYKQYTENGLNSLYTFFSNDIQSYIGVFSDQETSQPYILIRVDRLPENAKSLMYWFKNSEENNAMNFVFGVNISEQDKQSGVIKIYLSLLNDSNLFVYDNKNNRVGLVHNFVNDNSDEFNSQTYDDL